MEASGREGGGRSGSDQKVRCSRKVGSKVVYIIVWSPVGSVILWFSEESLSTLKGRSI